MRRAGMLVLIAVGLGGCDLAQGVAERQAITKAEFAFDHVELKRLDLPLLTPDAGVGLDLFLSVKNPNPVTARLDRLDYTVLLNDANFAAGSMTQDFSVPAGATASLVLPLTVPYTALPQSALSALEKRAATFTLNGTSHLTTPFGEIGFPVSVSKPMTF